jgi:TP901 family phage tail tape measure protein
LDEPFPDRGHLDSSLKNIQAVTGNTAQEMAGLRQELLAVGGKAIAGPAAVTAAYYDVAGGVADVSARMATLKASVALAEAGQADLGSATNGLIKVMNAYGYSADQADFAADVFTQTVGKGIGSMDEFVAAMSPIAGLTASVGVGFDEVGASMAYLTSKGSRSPSRHSSEVRISSLLNPNETLNKLLQSMGIASGSAMLKQYGLAESLNMIQSAAGGSQDAMAKALGSTEALQGAIALTQDSFNGFATDFGAGADGITAKARGHPDRIHRSEDGAREGGLRVSASANRRGRERVQGLLPGREDCLLAGCCGAAHE